MATYRCQCGNLKLRKEAAPSSGKEEEGGGGSEDESGGRNPEAVVGPGPEVEVVSLLLLLQDLLERILLPQREGTRRRKEGTVV